ncbi:unnamed protein product, partial [Rotaria socialis]
YCGVALRYVTDDFQLFTFILGCFPYNAASHSTQHLCEFVNKVLAEYNPVLGTTKFVVTDNEAKMLAAFREQCCRIGCADHYLNKQSQHAFQSEKKHSNRSTFEAGGCELAQTVFGHVKKIVSFVRHSHKQQKLPRELQNYSETRFAGAIIMVDIFREMYQNLPEVLINSNAMENYNAIEKDLLDDICNFLEPFQDVINALSKDRQLCLHQVMSHRQCLIEHCYQRETDSTVIMQLKSFLARRIKNAWYINDYHHRATILHPKLKNFEFCRDAKERSIDVLKQEYDKLELNNSLTQKIASNVLQNKNANPSQTSTTATTPKRKNLLTQCFD